MISSTYGNRKTVVVGWECSGSRVQAFAAAAFVALAVLTTAVLAPVTIDPGGGGRNLVGLKAAHAGDEENGAENAPWRVIAVTGSAHYRLHQDEAGWQAVSVGQMLEPYTEVRTGADGRLALSNGRDHVTLAPDSTVVLAHAANRPGDIAILQSAGQVHYQVKSRRPPKSLLSTIGQFFFAKEPPMERFDVFTPRLVASVKGTAFTVDVGAEFASVAVAEGVVRVASTAGDDVADVSAGRTASVASLSGGLFVVATPASATTIGGSTSSGPDSNNGSVDSGSTSNSESAGGSTGSGSGGNSGPGGSGGGSGPGGGGGGTGGGSSGGGGAGGSK